LRVVSPERWVGVRIMTIMLRNNRLGLLTALKYRVPDRFESFQ
jgi:hypothetical protein